MDEQIDDLKKDTLFLDNFHAFHKSVLMKNFKESLS